MNVFQNHKRSEIQVKVDLANHVLTEGMMLRRLKLRIRSLVRVAGLKLAGSMESTDYSVEGGQWLVLE